MFIRDTHKVDKKTGKKYTSYQLVEAFRTPKGPRQRILATINADLNLSLEERKLLANRIEEIVLGYSKSFFQPPEHVEVLAHHFAQLVLQNQSDQITPPPPPPPEGPVNNHENEPEETDYQPVDLNNVQHEIARSIGAEHVAYSAYRELGLPELFKELGFSKKQQQLAAGTIIGRAIAPASERATHHWLQNCSGLGELIGNSFATIHLSDLYKISDRIFEHKNKIENHLCEKEKDLFKLKESIILYDITNTYFEGSCKVHSKAKRGKSKEKRSDCPLISLGVVLDEDGFPKYSEIFEGNINERSTLKTMISRLDRGCGGNRRLTLRPIIVMDAGIATKENIEWLKSEGYLYIVMMKQKYRPLIEEASEIIVRNEKKQYVSVSLTKDEASGDNLLYCYSEQRHHKEKDIKETKVAAFEAGLKHIRDGLFTPRRMKNADKIKDRIGRLKQSYRRVSQHYQIEVHVDSDGQTAKDITWTYNSIELERSFSGTYSLRTNVTDLTPENLWELYMMLNEAESCFRCLKSEAGLRPNFHQLEQRIDGHIFISLLAYHLIATIQKKLRQQAIIYSWETIRAKMRTQTLVTSILKHKNGDKIYIRAATAPEGFHQKIYGALNIPAKPCGYHKRKVKQEDVVSNVFKKFD
jgi:transposase